LLRTRTSSSDFDGGGGRLARGADATPLAEGGDDLPAVAVKIILHAGHLTFFPISSSGISKAREQAGHLMLVGIGDDLFH